MKQAMATSIEALLTLLMFADEEKRKFGVSSAQERINSIHLLLTNLTEKTC
jgi:hypothetical protein